MVLRSVINRYTCCILVICASFLAKTTEQSPLTVEEMQDRIQSQSETLENVNKYLRMTDYFWNWFRKNEHKLATAMKKIEAMSGQKKSHQKELIGVKSEMTKMKENYDYELSNLRSMIRREANRRTDKNTFFNKELQSLKSELSALNVDTIQKKYDSSLEKIFQLSRRHADAANVSIEAVRKEALAANSSIRNYALKVLEKDETMVATQESLADLKAKVQNIVAQVQQFNSSLAEEVEEFKESTNERLRGLEQRLQNWGKEEVIPLDAEEGKLLPFKQTEREYKKKLRQLNDKITEVGQFGDGRRIEPQSHRRHLREESSGRSLNVDDVAYSEANESLADSFFNKSSARSLDLDDVAYSEGNESSTDSFFNSLSATNDSELADESSLVETMLNVNVTSETIHVDRPSEASVEPTPTVVAESYVLEETNFPSVVLSHLSGSSVRGEDKKSFDSSKNINLSNEDLFSPKEPGKLYHIPPILSSSSRRHRFIVMETPEIEHTNDLLPPRMIGFKSLKSKTTKK